MRRWFLVGFALFLASPAAAAVPSAANSTVPCIVMCPQGDIPLQITVRDFASNPVVNSHVEVVFCADGAPVSAESVPPFLLCCDNPCGEGGFTDAQGHFNFTLQGGGASANPTTVVIRADGVLLANRSSTSPDQNADLLVDATDLAIGTGLLGTGDVTMDLDCDGGLVDADDLAVISLHEGHVCHCPVPARRNSWGQMKTLYR